MSVANSRSTYQCQVMHPTFRNEQLLSFPDNNVNYKYRHAVLFGKFYPVHQGHLFLMQQALNRAEHVTIIVCHIPSEDKYPKFLRYFSVVESLREMFPERFAKGHIHVKLHDDPRAPQEPKSEHDHDFWRHWRHICHSHRSPSLPAYDLICTSEYYGDQMAETLGIEHFCVDLDRNTVPVAAREIRAGRRQAYRSEVFRRHQDFLDLYNKALDYKKEGYLKNEHHVLITGGESTGKTTATRELANRTSSIACLEWARDYLGTTDPHPLDFYRFFIAQAERLMEALVTHSRSFHDTSAYTTFTFFLLYQEEHTYEDYPFLEGLYAELLQFLKPLEQTFSQVYILPPTLQWEDDGTRLFGNQKTREQVYRMFVNYHQEILANKNEPFQTVLRPFDGTAKHRIILGEEIHRTSSEASDLDALYQLFKTKHPKQFQHPLRERLYAKSFRKKYLMNHH